MSYSHYTLEEAKKWAANVKDKKIRGSGWPNEYYFIPNGKINNDGDIRFEGTLYGAAYTDGIEEYWWVGRGFEPTEDRYKWILVYDWEAELESL